MAINAIGAAAGFAGPSPIARPTAAPTGGQPSASIAADDDFSNAITDALDSVQQSQQVADGLAQQAATGQLTDVADYMVASTQAQIATELTVAVRNRALESFQSIMSMQV
ncbi:flagellar hook-basal body complex protein FliE [Euzebya sp.]|uniref:flagellar hook-basal body complex protein FliE n=1 Tax=Euzebya sp. TaxID=1971409 RepID=UPI003517893D